jgi:probable phosphoglycerate mutase
MSTPLPTVTLARHGETEWTLSGQHTGRTDLPLTAHGEEVARALAPRLRDHAFAHVFTSPLRRAARTCELAGFGDVAEPADALLEWDYGAYEGLTTRQILANRPDWKLFRDGCPGGEQPGDVAARVDPLIERIRAVDGDVLLFSSAHLLRVLAARWLGLPPDGGRLLVLGTASLSRLGYEHGRDEPVLQSWNLT